MDFQARYGYNYSQKNVLRGIKMTYVYSKDWTKEQIFDAANELVGKKLGEIDKTNWLEKRADKGRIGNMIQSDFFGIPANSIKGPDFADHDIELKVTPVLKNKKMGYSSKERLVLGMINYGEDYKIPFESSIVNKKAQNMLLVFYLHEENTPVSEFKIIKTMPFQLKKDDEQQVRQDYESIVNKIKCGEAHEISEKQQVFLGACTKGQGKGKDWVKQPFSDQKAKSRAYSYKVGYMSAYFRSIMALQKLEHLAIPEEKSFLQVLQESLNKYIGKTSEEIKKETNYTSVGKSKSQLFNLISAMFETNGSNVNRTQEFIKEGYCIKTVTNRLDKAKNQDMSFPNIDFTEIYNDEFEDSTWYGYFAETTYVLAVWEEFEKDQYRFSKYIFWNPDNAFLQQIEKLYNHIKWMVRNNGVEVYNENKSNHDKWTDNLPKKGDFFPFQIRPKGSGESVIIKLPISNQLIKKKCIMIDKKFIRGLVGLEH